MRTLDKKLWRDLFQMKSQVLTIGLVVACGVSAFVASLSTYDSLNGSQETYYREAHFAQVFTPLKRAPEELANRIAELPGVAEAETRLVFDVTLDLSKVPEPVVGRMVSVPDGAQPLLNRLHLRKGRFIEPGHPNEVLVSEGFATANDLIPGDHLAAIFNGRRETLQMVGVALSPEYIYVVPGGSPIPDDKRFGIFWIGRPALASAFNMEGAFNNVLLTLGPGIAVEPVIDFLDRLLEPYGGLGAYGRSEQLSHRFISQEIRQQRAMATTLPMIFLGVAAFLLNGVIGRLVSTQREQIAGLKALGYENVPIAVHYLKLASIIVLAGAIVGLLFGIWLGERMSALYSSYFRFPLRMYRLDPWLPLLAVGISLAAMASGVLTAVYRVLMLAPAEAMRPPVPPAYRRTFIEKFGLIRFFSPQVRMIIRNITRRPLRAALTSLGIAFAVAILISGTFGYDAIDYMIHAQFYAAEREDAMIAFTQPVSYRARNEIEHLPGILYTEGFRDVPVKLSYGHRSYRTVILGIPQEAGLRRLLDAGLHPIPLLPQGILLTDRLADHLGVHPGGRLTVQALEGTRTLREAVVTSLVNDLVGLSAYMELDSLNRWMAEGDSITSVAVTVDPSLAGELYSQLKQLPKVATVNFKEASLQTFRETTARYIYVFIAILTGFAAIIAIGIVYNNARIALSERVWELASLRVLGFTRREVSSLLLGELALELFAGIPLGFWIGYLFASASIHLTDTEMFRLPLIIETRTYAYAAVSILAAGVVSALIVRHRIDHLDLVSVLKTRE